MWTTQHLKCPLLPSTSTLHLLSSLSFLQQRTEDRSEEEGKSHADWYRRVCMCARSLGSLEKVAWSVLTNWFLLFLPSIANYHERKKQTLKTKLRNEYIQKKAPHTHISTTSHKSHSHYNCTERRDYVQIKIRMHTNKDYSRLSLCHSWRVLLTQPKDPTFIWSFARPFI